MIEILKWKKPKSLGDIIKLFVSFFWYFTLWVLVLECLYYLGIIKNVELTLVIFHTVVVIGSYYIFNLKKNPFILKMYNFELRLGRNYLFVADIVIHWLTYLILIIIVSKKKLLNTLNLRLLILLPLFYLILFNPVEIYQLEILGYKKK